MDKLVRRVTVVSGSGDNRTGKVVYHSEDDIVDAEGHPNLKPLERTVRNMLKAQVVAAQDAYQRHIDSAAKEGNAWLTDAPANFIKARKKAFKEMRKSMPPMPFGMKHESEEN